ncbi:thiamine phosphate synthase [bacterium]|nr:thiamine phosphate synthase [bacterium]
MCGDQELIDIVTQAVLGGVTIVQLREKNLDNSHFVAIAKRLKKKLEQHRVPLIINDNIDVALEIGARGVHIGQQDMSLIQARKILKSDYIIGVSVSSVDEAILAEKHGADYIAVSPIWATPTKLDTPPQVGLEGVRKIRAVVKIPIVGIGNIKYNNAKQVIQAGCDGAAVVSAIMKADDPLMAAKKLIEVIHEEE